MNAHLVLFGLKEDASLEAIKKKYRVLSKKTHPDLNPSVDKNKFIQLNISYEWLLANHVPVIKPKETPKPLVKKEPAEQKIRKKDIPGHYKFFRDASNQRKFGSYGTQNINIELPISVLDNPAVIYIMLDMGQEIHLRIAQGTKFPAYFSEKVGIESYMIRVGYNPNIV